MTYESYDVKLSLVPAKQRIISYSADIDCDCGHKFHLFVASLDNLFACEKCGSIYRLVDEK